MTLSEQHSYVELDEMYKVYDNSVDNDKEYNIQRTDHNEDFDR